MIGNDEIEVEVDLWIDSWIDSWMVLRDSVHGRS